MEIVRIDHLVLTVKDIETTIRFYRSVLGMTVERFGQGRVALKFGNQKVNLHEHGREFAPRADRPTPGSADICFITAMKIAEAQTFIERQGIDIEAGPVARTGAAGPLVSIYFRDPDGNLIELSQLAMAEAPAVPKVSRLNDG